LIILTKLAKVPQTLSEKKDGPTVIPTLAKKITSELAEVRLCPERVRAACRIKFLLNYPICRSDFRSNFDVLVVALYMASDSEGSYKPL